MAVSDSGTNIGDAEGFGTTSAPCNFNSSPGFPVNHGNFNVRSGA